MEEYDFELDPPTMEEFELFLRLGNMLDMWDNTHQWTDLQIEEELCHVADLLELMSKKYDGMLMEYYEGQNRNNINNGQQDI